MYRNSTTQTNVTNAPVNKRRRGRPKKVLDPILNFVENSSVLIQPGVHQSLQTEEPIM